MTAASRAANPAMISTLQDWMIRWPKATNLSFDPETREPTIYSADNARTKVRSIPWVREGDIMTILAQPARFSSTTVAAARARYTEERQQREQVLLTGQAELQGAERAVLSAWRDYYAAPPAERASHRTTVLAAEKKFHDIEARLIDPNQRIVTIGDHKTAYAIINNKIAYTDHKTAYTPPFPLHQRGLPLTAVTAEQTA